MNGLNQAIDHLRPEEQWAGEILERVSEGILLLGPSLQPVLANRAAREMLGFQGSSLPPRVPSEEVLAVARRAPDPGGGIEEVIETWFPERQSLMVSVSKLDSEGHLLVVLENVTEEILAQRVRREFVAHASHELKSPVAGLQALAEALGHAVAEDDPEAVARFSARMVAESDRLGRLIADLLDLSKLEDPARVPDDPVNLSDVARRKLTEIEPAARAKRMSLRGGVEESVWVRGDEQQLGSMIGNLLDNALTYTREEGSILLEVMRDDHDALVVVTDDGIGISRDAQARVFERFYRVDRARSRDRGGTGLGLAIVKHVAELHGGCVKVVSTLGEGSSFTARIPSMTPLRASSPERVEGTRA
jgi:signal transduction histidine kinase